MGRTFGLWKADISGFSSLYTTPERRKEGLEKPGEFSETILPGTTVFREFPYIMYWPSGSSVGGTCCPASLRFCLSHAAKLPLQYWLMYLGTSVG